MFPPLIALGAVAATATIALLRKSGKKEMTPQQEKVYAAALNSLKDPIKLRELATAFEKEGFKEQAILLRKRAALRELPKDIAEKRREIFRQALSSNDPSKVLPLAVAFDKEGATGAAAKLREYAQSLQKAS